MLDLVFWSFAVAILPITLALGGRFLAAVAGPFGPPDAHPFFVHHEGRHAPHFHSARVSRTGGFGHGH